MQYVRARKFLNDHLSREVAGLVRKRLMPTGGQGRWAEGGTRATGPRLLCGRQRRSTPATATGRHGPRSTDIARSSVQREATLCDSDGPVTTVHAHTTRCVQIMPRPHPPESPLAPVIPSITATEFAAWLIAPKATGPCPWSAGLAEPPAPRSRHRPHETDEAITEILAIFGSMDR